MFWPKVERRCTKVWRSAGMSQGSAGNDPKSPKNGRKRLILAENRPKMAYISYKSANFGRFSEKMEDYISSIFLNFVTFLAILSHLSWLIFPIFKEFKAFLGSEVRTSRWIECVFTFKIKENVAWNVTGIACYIEWNACYISCYRSICSTFDRMLLLLHEILFDLFYFLSNFQWNEL